MILRAAWVFPVSAPPIRDGFVEIAGPRIRRVGSYPALAANRDFAGAPPSAENQFRDLGRAALLPGLINPHAHLELTCYRGALPRGPLWPWLAALIAARRAPGQVERETQAVIDGAHQSLRAGVTCVGDISRLNLAWRALRDVPIRKVTFVELLSIADLPPQNPAELRAAITEVVEDDLLTVGISPHAPYTVPAEHIAAAVALARAIDRPWCMHWAETPEEVAFLRGDAAALPPILAALARNGGVRPYGKSPIEALEQALGAGLAPIRGGALAHCNYLDGADIARLAAHRTTVIYCPRAHDFYGHRAHPWQRLRAAGVRVALGTDSLAANDSLGMLDEAGFLFRRGQAVGAPEDPTDLLHMITADAAAALGLDAQIGTLEPGKCADLAAFGLPPAHADFTPAQALQAILTQPPSPIAVFVGGKEIGAGRTGN